jgi:hypothetical protein
VGAKPMAVTTKDAESPNAGNRFIMAKHLLKAQSPSFEYIKRQRSKHISNKISLKARA